MAPHEAAGSAISTLGCTTTIPAFLDMGDSLKGKTENGGEVLVNENENMIMIDYSSFTASSGITAWSASYSHSNAADFTDVYPGIYTAHIVDEYEIQLNEKTAQQTSPQQNSHVQYPY